MQMYTPKAAMYAGKTNLEKCVRAIAILFDPLPFLSPFTVRGKILMQQVWSTGIDWDDILPEELQIIWIQWITERLELASFEISRCLRRQHPSEMQLHMFSDILSVTVRS